MNNNLYNSNDKWRALLDYRQEFLFVAFYKRFFLFLSAKSNPTVILIRYDNTHKERTSDSNIRRENK